MRNIWRRLKTGILYLSKKNADLYTFCYIFCFVLMVAAGVNLPDVFKSVLYPIVFEKQETGGIITEIIKDEVRVASGKIPRKEVLPAYYFEVDGFQIPVTAGIAKKYQEGEWYPYYIYEAGSNRIAERKNYILIYGMIGCVLEGFIFFVGAAFLLTETNEKEKIGKEKAERGENGKAQYKQDYHTYKTKELYELCLARDLKVTEGKKNNRRYLEQCLRTADDSDLWLQRQRKHEKRTGHWEFVIYAAVILFMIFWYSRTIYYFIRLF